MSELGPETLKQLATSYALGFTSRPYISDEIVRHVAQWEREHTERDMLRREWEKLVAARETLHLSRRQLPDWIYDWGKRILTELAKEDE